MEPISKRDRHHCVRSATRGTVVQFQLNFIKVDVSCYLDSSAATDCPQVTSDLMTAHSLSPWAFPPDVLPHAWIWKRLLKALWHCGKALSWSATRFGLFILTESFLFFGSAGSPCSCFGGLFRWRKRTSAESVVLLVPWGSIGSMVPSSGASHLLSLLPVCFLFIPVTTHLFVITFLFYFLSLFLNAILLMFLFYFLLP